MNWCGERQMKGSDGVRFLCFTFTGSPSAGLEESKLGVAEEARKKFWFCESRRSNRNRIPAPTTTWVRVWSEERNDYGLSRTSNWFVPLRTWTH